MKKKLLSTLLIAGLILVQPLSALASDGTAASEPEVPSTEEAIFEADDTEQYHAMASDAGVGTWKLDSTGWWFDVEGDGYPSDGLYQIGDAVYGFDSNGYMVTGWYKLVYGTNSFDYDWYYFNSEGQMQYGWQYLGGNWYYLDPDYGYMYYFGARDINGTTYVFGTSGAMVTGWSYYSYTFSESYDDYSYSSVTSGWLYANPDGTLYNGWLYQGGNWYYILESGIMARGAYPTGVDAKNEPVYYVFNNSGAMIYGGWVGIPYNYTRNGVTTNGISWYYANSDGSAYNGWLWYNGSWYYIYNGYMNNNGSIIDDSGNAYFLEESGVMRTTPGWVSVNWSDWSDQYEDWFYVKDTSGKLTTGWEYINGNWYYFYDSGYMANDTVVYDDGKYSAFDASGHWTGYVDGYNY